MSVRIFQGDVLERLREMADGSVHCVMTSPPYWGLRDYGIEPSVWGGDPQCEHEWWIELVGTEVGKGNWWAQGTNGQGETQPGGVQAKREPVRATAERGFCSKCAAWRGCLGLEPTPEMFIEHLVAVFREVRRVLRKDGVCWVNMGDGYNAGTDKGRRWSKTHNKYHGYWTNQKIDRRVFDVTTKPKDLIGMPWRMALALQADGWWLRCDVIWAKPNPMPESVADRPAKAHEYLFLLTRSARYFYDAEAVKEAALGGEMQAGFRGVGSPYTHNQSFSNDTPKKAKTAGIERGTTTSRNLRSVWTIATAPFPEAHFATFPPALVEPCIKAGTSERGCCPSCGAPWRRVVEKGKPDLEHQRMCGGDANGQYDGQATKDYGAHRAQDASATKARILAGMTQRVTTGWEPTCKCGGAVPVACVVLDPFGGSGTVGLVAQRLGRDAVLIERKAEYCAMAKRRIEQEGGMFAEVEIGTEAGNRA